MLVLIVKNTVNFSYVCYFLGPHPPLKIVFYFFCNYHCCPDLHHNCNFFEVSFGHDNLNQAVAVLAVVIIAGDVVVSAVVATIADADAAAISVVRI